MVVFILLMAFCAIYIVQLIIVFDSLLSRYYKQYNRKVDFLLDLIPFRPFIKQFLESFNNLK
jgi:hypothetical protein